MRLGQIPPDARTGELAKPAFNVYIGAAGFPTLPPVQAGLERGRQDQAPYAPASMTQLVGPPGGVHSTRACGGDGDGDGDNEGQMGGQRYVEMNDGMVGAEDGEMDGDTDSDDDSDFDGDSDGEIDGLHALRSAGGCTRVLQPLHPAWGRVHGYCDGDGIGDNNSDGQMDGETP